MEVYYTGKKSHASAFPELGVNAADALTIAQTALGLLRQHIRSTDRIHGRFDDSRVTTTCAEEMTKTDETAIGVEI